MALINCPDCGKEISDKAASCIHCGCPICPPNENISSKTKSKIDNENFDSSKFRLLDGAGQIDGQSNSSGSSSLGYGTWKCPTCGKALARNAKFCPNCGQRDPHLLKWFPYVMIGVVIFLCIILSGGR